MERKIFESEGRMLKWKTKNEFIKDFLKGGIAISCPTEDESGEFQRTLEEEGFTWNNGYFSIGLGNGWEHYKEKTVWIAYPYVPGKRASVTDREYIEQNHKEITVIPYQEIRKLLRR